MCSLTKSLQRDLQCCPFWHDTAVFTWIYKRFLLLCRNGRLQDWHHGHLPRDDSEVCDSECSLCLNMFYWHDCKHTYNICLERETSCPPCLGSGRSVGWTGESPCLWKDKKCFVWSACSRGLCPRNLFVCSKKVCWEGFLRVQLFAVILNTLRFLLTLGVSGKDISDHNHKW